MSKSKKAVFLSEWTNEVGQTMRQFHEGAALMVRKHQKSSIKNSTFANTLHSMSQREHSPIVKSAIETLSVELTAGEEHRTHTLAQLQANVVAQFDKYNEKLKVQEENIRARNEAFATFVKKQKAFVNAKSAANPTKQRHAREVFEHEHKRLQSAEQTLNTAIVQFENQRVADMKGFLAKFISSQMYFYTRQLEGLSRAYAEVIAIDPVHEAEKWGEEMRKLEQMEMEQGDISATLTQAAQEQLVLDNPQHNLPTNQPTDQSNQGTPADHSHLNLPPKIDPYATPFNQPTNSNQQSHQNQPQHNSQFNNQVNNQHNNPYNQPINQNNQQQLQSTMSTSPYMNNQPTNQQFNQSNHSNNMQQSQSPYQSTNQQYQATQQTPYNPYNQSNNQSNNNGPYNQSNQSQLNNQYNQSNNQPYNQSNNPSFNQGNHQSFNQSTNFNQSLNKPMNQPMNQSSPFSNTANYANYMNPQPKHNPYSSNQSTNQRGGWQESKQQM